MTIRIYRMLVLGVGTLLCWLLFCCQTSPRPVFDVSMQAGTSGIVGKIVNAATKEPLPARIVVQDEDNNYYSTHYEKLPGIFTDSTGVFSVDLAPGTYNLQIFHGIDFISQSQTIHIPKNQRLHISAGLQPWVNLREKGWINGDGHAHLYTSIQKNTAMLDTVRQVCLAQGVDFLSTNQGWAGYDDASWMAGYEKYTDSKFLLTYGAEMPKYRTGHIWWLGLESTRGYFDAAMDSMYENYYYKNKARNHWKFDDLPLKNIPDVYLVPQIKKVENAVAIVPHPTSWWREDGKYVSNVCENLAFGLLSNQIWDGMVVMGYNADHYFYQDLWFSVLSNGYKIPALAELDGGYGKHNKFPYGMFRTYFQTNGELSVDAAADAVRQGRTFVTSGPLVFAKMDRKFDLGTSFPTDGKKHTLHLQALASGDAADTLSFVIVFRNAEIFKLWDLRGQGLREFSAKLSVQEMEQAWYAIKVYGNTEIADAANLDVHQVCENIMQGTFAGLLDANANIAISSPFYFGYKEPSPFLSRMNLHFIDPKTKEKIRGGYIELVQNGKVIYTMRNLPNSMEFSMPVNAVIRFVHPNYPVIHRGLFLDYKPYANLVEEFANGDWLQKYGLEETMSPGQVPWQMFRLGQSKKILQNVTWEIPVEPNDRDALWQDFYSRFQ